MDSNSQPYRLSKINDLTYGFTTDAGVIYQCSFISYAEYFFEFPEIASKVYAFNIDKKNTALKTRGIDPRIADTVVKIVGDFLVSQINAVVYVCDPSDGKGNARFKKFKSWFEYYTHDSAQIVQISDFLETDSGSLHAVLLVHKKNKLRDQFVKAFFDLNDGDK
jgi:Family of unknown function (DUF6169)